MDDGQKIGIYYPEIDTRYQKNHITSHDALQLPSIPLALDTARIQHQVLDMVFLDEIHFFKPRIIGAIKKLLSEGIDVVVSGLDKNFRGEGFGIVPDLMTMADELVRLEAKCNVCGRYATFTQRVSDDAHAGKDDKTIVIGGKDLYEARCAKHFIKPQ